MSTQNLCLLVLSAIVAGTHIFLAHRRDQAADARHNAAPAPRPARSRPSIPVPRTSSAHL
jgi:hypothetical protein